MSTNSFESFETYTQGAEQDLQGDGNLPTYDDLAAQSSPNSRFGRWRGWIEKRAAERYADTTQEDLVHRRTRGWQLEDVHDPNTPEETYSVTSTAAQVSYDKGQTPSAPLPLRIRISEEAQAPVQSAPRLDQGSSQPSSSVSLSSTDPLSQSQQDIPGTARDILTPTHLQIHQFGSRFLPHTTSPIRCILPLQRDRLLLLGTDSGLSVLDMYPIEWRNDGNPGIVQKGPSEAQAHVVWTGEAVFQMSILEYEDVGEGTPQGVVLALVGPGPDAPSSSTTESLRTLRMYNLASLTSLAKWIITQAGKHPVDLRHASDWNVQQTPVKKHRSATSITRGLKSLIIESPTRVQQPVTSYESYLAVPNAKRHTVAASADATWDVVDDLPLRWATDFVPLANSGSRLASSSVTAYALWHEGGAGVGGGRHGRRALLAVATKCNIFLYETPKGERAFHFVKDFYTPVPPRNLAFVQQSVQDTVRSTDGSARHSRGLSSDAYSSAPNGRMSMAAQGNMTYSAQMALFVVFDKKAGIIRIADAAVSEVEMYDTANGSPLGGGSLLMGKDSLTATSALHTRRSRASIDFMAFKESKGNFTLPTLVGIPATQLPSGGVYPAKSIYVLTRGKTTHLIPAPLPATIPHTRPLYTFTWSSSLSSVTARVCVPRAKRSRPLETPPFLQLIGMGENGIEVQEIPLAAFIIPNGKGKAVALAEPRRGDSFLGETGFLAVGGHWHRSISVSAPVLERTDSATSTSSFESTETEEIAARLRAEAGLYGWLRKDAEDWRVFWVGGDVSDVAEHDEEEDGVLV